MKNKFLSLVALSVLLVSCSDDDNNTTAAPQLKLNLTGLENLGTNYRYEGWVVVNGAPVTTGTFTVNDAGVLSQTTFDVAASTLANATAFVLSIEPANDPDPAPSNTKYLVGDFSGNSASVNTGIIGDFSGATGKYLIASPTDGGLNPYAGVWFMNGVTFSSGFNLPTIDVGWKYEGWVVSNDGSVVLSTGKFTNPAQADETAQYSGAMAGPPFPGEDFITNAPAGITFPGNLRGTTLVITVEPNPDNSPVPFTIKPLSHQVSQSVIPGDTNDMMRSLTSFPSGTVTR
jgi:hypothetical protein